MQSIRSFIYCHRCGRVELTPQEYDQQMKRPGALWFCPDCKGLADWDHIEYRCPACDGWIHENQEVCSCGFGETSIQCELCGEWIHAQQVHECKELRLNNLLKKRNTCEKCGHVGMVYGTINIWCPMCHTSKGNGPVF